MLIVLRAYSVRRLEKKHRSKGSAKCDLPVGGVAPFDSEEPKDDEFKSVMQDDQ